jgi:hypothetical protein
MSRHYFPSTVFRMTPKNTLREVFSHLGADVSTTRWSELGFHHFEPAQRLFDAMPPACRAQADLVFRQIHLLACREGMDAINEATEMRHKGTQQFGPGSATNRYERAALVWIRPQQQVTIVLSIFIKELPMPERIVFLSQIELSAAASSAKESMRKQEHRVGLHRHGAVIANDFR